MPVNFCTNKIMMIAWESLFRARHSFMLFSRRAAPIIAFSERAWDSSANDDKLAQPTQPRASHSQSVGGSSQERTRHFTLVKPAPHFRANQVKQVLQRDYTLRATICNNNNNNNSKLNWYRDAIAGEFPVPSGLCVNQRDPKHSEDRFRGANTRREKNSGQTWWHL